MCEADLASAPNAEDMAARLFANPLRARPDQAPAALSQRLLATERSGRVVKHFVPEVTEELVEIFERVPDPDIVAALCRLFLARLETMRPNGNPDLAELWRSSPVLRRVHPNDILGHHAMPGLVKELFNYFFRDDLYGQLRNSETLILSSGSICEESFGLSTVGKAAIAYSLDRDWYGYSSSNGRINAREALACLENARLPHADYSATNIAITMGATHAINCVADLVLGSLGPECSPVLAAIPNYPPLVKSVTRSPGIRMVPLACEDGSFSADPLIEMLRQDTPLVLLQSVANPTGARVDEDSLERLIKAASSRTMILIDECHEFLGSEPVRSQHRRDANVIRVVSLSKFSSVPGMKLGWIIADTPVIDAYYEIASTKYGGPPSFFFTLLEVYGRLERFRLEGLNQLSAAELAEFDEGYGLSIDTLARAYDTYRQDWNHRTNRLIDYRSTFAEGLQRAGFDIVTPRYSINMLAFDHGVRESYPAFRALMARANVATYPGILNFCFGSNGIRFSSARPWLELETALERFLA